MKNSFVPQFVWLAVALLTAVAASAAIPLGTVERFDAAPTNTSWSTRFIPGTGSSLLSALELDEMAQTNSATDIVQPLPTTLSPLPGTGPLAGWSSAGGFIYTRAGGVLAQCLMATVENTSSSNLGFVSVRYRAGIPASNLGEDVELIGHRAFFSLSGEPGSWNFIPEFTTLLMPPSDGRVCANLEVGDWPPGAMLYLLWIDDNGGPGADSLFSIDDFSVTPPVASLCPALILQPQPASVTTLTGRTTQLVASAVGANLTYQWHKESFGPLSPLQNATATSATLILTNVRVADSGNYFVVVSSAAGSVTSLSSRVVVNHDDIPPRILGARLMPDDTAGVRTAFHIQFDEAICADPQACGGDATEPFNWWVEDLNEPGQFNLWPLPGYLTGGTNLVLPIDLEGRPPRTYALHYIGENYVTDLFGYPLAAGTVVTVNPTLIVRPGDTNYTGVEDTELEAGNASGGPDVPHGHLPSILVDDLNTTGPSHGLLQFKNLFGYGARQIVPGSTIRRAVLRLNVTDSSSSRIEVNRMSVPWSEDTATWNSFGGGIQPTHFHGSELPFTPGGQFPPFPIDINVLNSLGEWSARGGNHGWGFRAFSSDGFNFDSSETATGPALIVEFQPNFPPCAPAFQNDAARSMALLEGQSATLAPEVTGYPLLVFQWLRDGAAIPGATTSTITVTSADVCAGPARYQLRAVCPAGNSAVTSAPVTISLLADIVRPTLRSVIGNLAGTAVTLTFSKSMNPTNATNAANYSFTPPLPVTLATLSSNDTVVTLTTPPRGLTQYSLRIAGVTDNRACAGGFLLQPNPTDVPITGVQEFLPWASEWLFATNSQDATLSGAPWFAPGFVPGAGWKTGMALLGHETSPSIVALFPTPLRTFVPPNTNTPPDFVTSYYRRTIELPPLPSGAIYVLGHFIDDGAVFHLNGVEFARVNMPAGNPVLSATRALAAGEASVQYLPLPATPGTHLLAVELHQGGTTTSADNLFGAQILALTPPPALSITNPSTASTTWFADSSWQVISSTNVSGPYLPWTAAPPINDARFFQLRFRGVP